MSKPLKIFLIVLISLLGIGSLISWYAVSSINTGALTKFLSSTVKEATGRDLTILGPVSLTFFPSIGLKAEQVNLSNAQWASDPQMLSLKQVELDIKLLPLFAKRVEISSINAQGLVLHLQSNKAGQDNWDLSLPSIAPSGPTDSVNAKNSSSTNIVTSTATVANTATTDTSSGESNFVAITSIHISDAQISYQGVGNSVQLITVPQILLEGSGSKTTVLLDLQYENYKLLLKGKTSALRQAIIDWDQAPVNMKLDFNLSLNGKALDINGQINKNPKKLPQFDIKMSSKSFDLIPLAAAAAVSASSNMKKPVTPKKSEAKYFFSDQPLPFDLIPKANGKVSFNIAELNVPDQAPFKNLQASLLFKDDILELSSMSFDLGKGQAEAQGVISQFNSASPLVSMKGMAKGFTLEQIIASTDSNAKVSGGNTQLAFNLSGKGKSLHQMAASSNGALQISINNATLDSKLLNKGGDFVITVLDAVNPMRKKTNNTILECAVAYLPLTNGMIPLKNSVGVETDRLDVALSGNVNLNTEVINIKIDPQEKSGITTGIDLGGLVQLVGTLQNPQVGVSKEGVVNSAVSIGLGFLTGGISIAAENAKSLASKRQSCSAALHSWASIYPGSN
jgi:uncharacterized protein involved in outer membrane biogenesis